MERASLNQAERNPAPAGEVVWVSGPVVRIAVQRAISMGELMAVGEERLAGEVIELSSERAVLQVYE